MVSITGLLSLNNIRQFAKHNLEKIIYSISVLLKKVLKK